MTFYVKKTTQPIIEPVTITELKSHLKLTGTAEDTYLTALVTASREALEAYTGRSWCSAGFTLALPSWFSSIELPYAADNTTVTSVSYQDDSYPSPITYTTIPATDYVVCTDVSPAVIRMKQTWSAPAVTLAETDSAVKVVYTTGFATANSIPTKFKHALLLYAGYLYDNREAEVKIHTLPFTVKALLETDRIHSALSYTRII